VVTRKVCAFVSAVKRDLRIPAIRFRNPSSVTCACGTGIFRRTCNGIRLWAKLVLLVYLNEMAPCEAGAWRSWANSLSQGAANGPQEDCENLSSWVANFGATPGLMTFNFASIRWPVEICSDPEFVFGIQKRNCDRATAFSDDDESMSIPIDCSRPLLWERQGSL